MTSKSIEAAQECEPNSRLNYLDTFYLERTEYSLHTPANVRKSLEEKIGTPQTRYLLEFRDLFAMENTGHIRMKPESNERECLSLVKPLFVKNKKYYLMRYEWASGIEQTAQFHYVVIDPQYSDNNKQADPLKYLVEMNDDGICLLSCRNGVKDITQRSHRDGLINVVERSISRDLPTAYESKIFRTCDNEPMRMNWYLRTTGKVSI